MDSRCQKAYWVKITNKMSASQISTLIDRLIEKADCTRIFYYCYDSDIEESEYLICAREGCHDFLKVHSTTSPIGKTIMLLDEEVTNSIDKSYENQQIEY